MYEKDLLNDEIMFKFKELEIPELILRELKEKRMAERNFIKKKKQGDNENCSEKEFMLSPITERKPNRQKIKRAASPNILEDIGFFNLANECRTFVGRFRLDTVHVKQIPKTHVYLSRDVLVELKDVRDLIHPNLNPYAGFCLETPYVLILSGMCQKGSLMDILQNEDIQLNWVFRLTFAMDIATGLATIHESPIKIHGHLTSHNILIDSRWNCKISDYGLLKFKSAVQPKITDENEDAIYTSLLWTAPESISVNVARRKKEGDIYSFGIIVSDIINRLPPFSVYSQYRPREIIHFIHKRCIPPFRPHVRLQTGLDGRILDLMRQCWDEFPANRPTIQGVRTTLKTILKDKSDNNNLLDNMIEMMEKYSQGLESRIRELNHEKDEERSKLEKVLYKSLPKSIAKQLRSGQPILAENFYEASVLTFKVDDFAKFLQTQTPQQMIDLLNDVYQIIDDALTPNVHKIHVCRDQHVLVCGMPEQGIKKHAYVIAKTALKIMGSLTTFRFRHIEDNLMRFKIAIHSGAFVAGVVGRHIPVYTVLGKAIEYAEAVLQVTPTLRILVTKECKAALSRYKGITLEKAGPVMVKGYGFLEGDFLTAMSGLKVKLRDAVISQK
ncbi:atrial natriuretic peptide receptor 1-like [Hydractinia symbiolongicarpus]|uniref:atrial natriuretic peptide receptor 1-like n=1 Tax=Hydractinia symbiolongicarpus TaxID=13093 RepID=UPI00254C5C48|nr:atrial natriuretic peptide receptor 1-like [Hydractinia symbiolongicarpus]